MAVGAPFNTVFPTHQGGGGGTYDATLTVAGGHSNTALMVLVGWDAVGVTATSVTWDPVGANQALTSVGAANNFGASLQYRIQGFYLVNPTPGASKILRVILTGAAIDMDISAAAFDGVDQTTPTANLTSNTTGAALTVTAVSGDATMTFIATSNSVTSTDKTEIGHDSSGPASGYGGDYALASGNVTHTWTASGSTQGVTGFAIKQFVASAFNPGRLFPLMGVG